MSDAYNVTLFWSQTLGKFVDKLTGKAYEFPPGTGPTFSGDFSMWCETLIETVIVCQNQLFEMAKPKLSNTIDTVVYAGPLAFNLFKQSSIFQRDSDTSGKVGALFQVRRHDTNPTSAIDVTTTHTHGEMLRGHIKIVD